MIAKIKGIFIVLEFVVTILILIMFLYMFKSKRHKIRKIWANMESYIMGFNIIEKGKPDTEAKLILVNHQSVVDIIALEAIYPKDQCWVAKKELQQIPLFGHIITAPEMIAIDRKDKRSIIKIIKLTKQRVSEGRVVAMFPEGTRGDGQNLLEFQNGAKILAEKLNLKVQPIVITNTKHIFDSQKLTAHSGNITIEYLSSIDPKKDENWFTKMKEDMQGKLNDELANYTSHR
ncbi:MAG TPA: 1-acyl-sn-glycerol-3-phosphate acyltransferase [Sulfurospirillum arcachonense]|nr:1-acyl-sn-glycerol-3-phosphate acyltransferase [Sulfurospirillum arcachonense]HIP44829.1 1-acyl-sn-glycerol-3-phosphate acyltransferase [Sulfurospirillum arcachonense]